MQCLQVTTDVILAELFAASPYPASFGIKDLREFFSYLSEKFPVYLDTDLSDQAVRNCADMYSEIYCISETADGETFVKSAGFRPNLKYFTHMYSEANKNYLKQVTEEYIKAMGKG